MDSPEKDIQRLPAVIDPGGGSGQTPTRSETPARKENVGGLQIDSTSSLLAQLADGDISATTKLALVHASMMREKELEIEDLERRCDRTEKSLATVRKAFQVCRETRATLIERLRGGRGKSILVAIEGIIASALFSFAMTFMDKPGHTTAILLVLGMVMLGILIIQIFLAPSTSLEFHEDDNSANS
jgi:hypothetical protein